MRKEDDYSVLILQKDVLELGWLIYVSMILFVVVSLNRIVLEGTNSL